MESRNKKSHVLKAVPIRLWPPAVRRRGEAMKELHSVVQDTFRGRAVVKTPSDRRQWGHHLPRATRMATRTTRRC